MEERWQAGGRVNRIRRLVTQWRVEWPDVTPVTRDLLEHWYAGDRARRRLFCQVETLQLPSS